MLWEDRILLCGGTDTSADRGELRMSGWSSRHSLWYYGGGQLGVSLQPVLLSTGRPLMEVSQDVRTIWRQLQSSFRHFHD